MRVIGRCIGGLAIATALLSCLLSCLLSWVASAAAESSAESWPQRTVRIIVPIGSGSTTDIAARLFADRLADRWKQAVIVENRPGADGQIGVTAFVGMHDDHALLYSFGAPLTVLPLVREKLPYDPERDLVPIAAGTHTFGTVSVATSLNVGSLAELVALARSTPGKLNCFASAGAFTYLLAGFLQSAGVDMVPVAYREQNLALQDHGEGRIHVVLSAITNALPLVQAGKVRFVAVTNDRRAPALPEVPTVAEAGYPELAFEGFAGFFGSRGLPTELRDRIAADIRAVAADPGLIDRLAAVGQLARGTTPAEFSAMMEEQRAKMASIVKSLGAKPQR